MNDSRKEMKGLAMQQHIGAHRFGHGNKDVGAVCETPGVIELGDVSERHCYNDIDVQS